ncbi:hypothetical protein Scep_016465 [Stephania cephalantha]|uniref:Uncharacterized protein n=1 Tax=Stephania cephalantha TaxID=152367 RepID=A0AAP0NSM8_9MAGN
MLGIASSRQTQKPTVLSTMGHKFLTLKGVENMINKRLYSVRLSKLEMLKRRGKGPPKKGQGRRAMKRNK